MTLEQSILATLTYSDIFDYPLNFEEIHRNLIFKKSQKSELKRILEKLAKAGKILKYSKFYQLKKSKNLARIRILRKNYAQRKFKKAKLAAKILSFIPQVKLIGVSGALATSNTPQGDDIDFFIISAANSLWTTRFFCNLFLDAFGLRRRAGSKKIADKICLNMFLTKDGLKLSPADLYLAHEILQLQPLFERENTHAKFLRQNLWVFKFLPNWMPNAQRLKTNDKGKNSSQALVFKPLAKVCENLLKNFQLKYMKKRITKEVISDTKLFFHPTDAHQRVLAEFKDRSKMLKIPLDKAL